MSNQKPISLLLPAVMVLPLILFTTVMPNDTYTQVRMQGPAPFISQAKQVLRSALGDHTIHRNTGDGFLDTFISFTMDPVEEWGTKWDVYDVSDLSVELQPAHAGFAASSVLRCIWYTAWSPCIEGLMQISASRGVDFTIKYIDEGDHYTGFTTIIDGKINHEHVWTGIDVPAGIYQTFGFNFWFKRYFEDLYGPEVLQELAQAEYLNEREQEYLNKHLLALESPEQLSE